MDRETYLLKAARQLYANPLSQHYTRLCKSINAGKSDPLTCSTCGSIQVPGISAVVRLQKFRLQCTSANRRQRQLRARKVGHYLSNVEHVKGKSFRPSPDSSDFLVTSCRICGDRQSVSLNINQSDIPTMRTGTQSKTSKTTLPEQKPKLSRDSSLKKKLAASGSGLSLENFLL